MSDNAKYKHIFIAYASKDEAAYKTLMSQLEVLAKEIPIETWGKAELMPGAVVEETTEAKLKSADILLLLVSAELLTNESYINLQSQLQTTTQVVPVLLRPCAWENDPFLKKRQVLPKSEQFISLADDKDEVYTEIVRDIKKMVVGKTEDLPKPKAFTITNRIKKVFGGKPENLPKTKRSVTQIHRPKVFISYSWDSEIHKAWVKHLADKLFANGVDVVLDQYEMKPGDNMNHFMERAVADVDKVLLVLTENYKKKADNRGGGVGYEYSMINTEWYEKQTDNDKFIPILRGSNSDNCKPVFLNSIIYLDMSDDIVFEEKLEELLYQIYDKRRIEKPPLGDIPDFIKKRGNLPKPNTDIVSSSNVDKSFDDKPIGTNAATVDNDFLINSTKYRGDRPPVVLQNGFNKPLQFFGSTYNLNTIIPYKDDRPLYERSVPNKYLQYPYITVSDFLEPYLIKVPYSIDGERFFTGNPDGFYAGDIHTQDPPDDMFLLPIKNFYFTFFSIKDLMDETINGSKIFKLIKISEDAVKAELLIPISKKGEYIKFERMYQTLTSNPNEYANEGALIESNLNLGFLPYNLDNKVSNQIVGLISKSDRVELDFLKDLSTTCSSVQDKHIHKTLKTTMAHGLDLCSTYYILEDNYDLLRIKDKKTGVFGMVIPKPNKRIRGAAKKIVFAVDFGITHSHIEYSIDGSNPQPFKITEEDTQLVTLVYRQWGATDPLLVDLLERELIPFSLGRFYDDYKFPIITAVSEVDSFEHLSGVNAIADINIPFEYGKKAKLPGQVITTNLKWKLLSGSYESQANANRVKAFIETLMIMMKNKVLLNEGALKKTEVIWFYSTSMRKNQFNQYRSFWNELYRIHFNPKGNTIHYSSAEAPFYVHLNKVSSYDYPVVSINIKSNVTEIVIFENEQPQIMTSVRFAENAVFGDAYSVTKKMDNGFVTVFKPYVEQFLSANYGTLFNLYERFNQINVAGQCTSAEMIAFFFSIENNSKVKNNRELDFSVSKAIANHGEFNIVFLIFYSAIIYHIAQLMNALSLKMPRNLCFNGNGSKIINLLDTNDELESLEEFSKLIFERVYEQEYHRDGMQLIRDSTPKESTCKGGIIKYQMKLARNEFDKIVLLGDKDGKYINPRQYNFKANNLKYSDIEGNDQLFVDVVTEIERFIDMVFDIDKEFSLEEYFGIDTSNLSRYRELMKGDLSANLRKGFQAKLRLGMKNRSVEESLFFYPLISSIYRMTQEIAKKKS